jgi:uncharacterized coiled-coil DUF342 family protein
MDQELKAYLDQRFQEIAVLRQELDQRFQENSQQIAGVRQEMRQELDQQISGLRQEMREHFEEAKEMSHHTQILVEDLHGKVCLLAEGLLGFSEQLENHRTETGTKIEEVKASVAPAYRDLSERTKTQYDGLDRRVAALESRAARERRDVFDVICERFNLQRPEKPI